MTEAKESIALTPVDLAKFDWLQLQKDMNEALPQENNLDRLLRKSKENPFVIIGTTVTTAALCYGIYNFIQGRTKQSQYMMRTRVAAQGFTIAAIVIGSMYGVATK